MSRIILEVISLILLTIVTILEEDNSNMDKRITVQEMESFILSCLDRGLICSQCFRVEKGSEKVKPEKTPERVLPVTCQT